MEDKFVVVHCCGEVGTIIGDYMFIPNTSPVAVDVLFYNSHKKEFDHYEKNGVFVVYNEAAKQFARLAAMIKAEEKRRSEEQLNPTPPPPFSIPVGNIPEDIGAKMATAAEKVVRKCVAVTKNGIRCKNDCVEGSVLCKIHKKQFMSGAELFDEKGNMIVDAKFFDEE